MSTQRGAAGVLRSTFSRVVWGIALALVISPSAATQFDLPAAGAAVIGADTTITVHYENTLADLARRYSLGYVEIIHANPSVDLWVPEEGKQILLPGRRILPPGPRDGVVVNLAEHRLYYFPKRVGKEKAMVFTYPVSIGKMGRTTPLGVTYIRDKAEHPSWYPTASIRKEHADRGDLLPAVVGPGPDNPLGEFKMRLAMGDGTYEIHGTNNPTAVGLAITHGCVRMYPEDVATLFPLAPVGTKVRFVNVPVKVAWIDGKLLLEVHRPIDAQAESFELEFQRLSALLRAAVGDARVAIHWDYVREVLRQASGVIATVGIETGGPAVNVPREAL
jgi:L,D-transpeptidase ErfK/SrfK